MRPGSVRTSEHGRREVNGSDKNTSGNNAFTAGEVMLDVSGDLYDRCCTAETARVLGRVIVLSFI